MKCQQCHKEGLKYLEKKKKKEITINEGKNLVKKTIYERDSRKAKCNKCGWNGEI